MHPILLLIVLLITLYGISWFKRLPAQKRNEGLRKLLIYGGALALIVLVVTGRLNPLFALLGGAIPLIYRAHGAYRLLRGVQGAFQGGRPSNAGPGSATQSVVRSKYLEMTLDHASGSIGGVVLQGMNAGDNLSGLSLQALLAMRAHYKNDDPQSLALLDAYLDQVHQGWHAHCADPEDSDASASHAPMSASEASEMLGVRMDATPEEIREAHRRLMQKLHPDRGGSTYLAAKVNIAKQVLLKHVGA